jgi:hypothetical protein
VELRSWQEQVTAAENEQWLRRIDLVEGGGRLEPGVYVVRLETGDGRMQQQALIVSPLHLTLKSGERDALVWAVDQQSGRPASGVTIDLFDEQGTPLGSAVTGSDGTATAQLARTENYGLLAIAREPFAAVAATWGRGVGAWDFGLRGSSDLPELTAHMYTDRPIYRAGQEVSYRGIIRAEDDVNFQLPPARHVEILVSDPIGNAVAHATLQLSSLGSFTGAFGLPAGAALGDYTISAQIDNRWFNTTFQVAAYRPPEIETTVTLPLAEIVRGTATTADVAVNYFFGGPAAGIPVQWNILSAPYTFAPDWGGRFRFGDTDDPWLCFYCWWRPQPEPQPILSGSGTTDAQGRLAIALPAELRDPQGNVITSSVRLTIEATATGRDNQAISGRSELVVHAGDLYVGLASQSYLGRAGDEQIIDLVASDTQGRRRAGQSIDVEFIRYTWENTQVQVDGGTTWEWREVRTPIASQTVTTDAQGAAVVRFTPPEGGSYRVAARARDGGGREVRSAIFVWVSGPRDIAWRRDNNDRIDLIADKVSYTPGETATILAPSPFQGTHWALFTVERGRVLSHEVRQVSSNSIVYQLPITDAHAPNVYVTVTLFSAPPTAGAPADYKVGILPLAVEPVAQELQVRVTSSAGARAEPGQIVGFDVAVSDAAGRPVAAELSLDLVDKAVLSLRPRTPNAIREAFYGTRPLGIFTSAALATSLDRLLAQLSRELLDQPADETFSDIDRGGTMSDNIAAGAPSPTAMPAEAVAQEGAKAQEPSGAAVRQEFADTAYWNGSVITDASGRASIQVTLPDNLTTWVMRGVGANDATQVGEGLAEVIATKPLLVRPVTPRFFVAGDTAELAANVSNNGDTAVTAEVWLDASGVTLTTPQTVTLQVGPRSEARATWGVDVPLDPAGQPAGGDPLLLTPAAYADLVFQVRGGQASDASRPRLANGPGGTLPIYRYSVPEVVGAGGQIETAGARAEAIGLPPDLDPTNGEVTVRLDPSLAAGLRDSLDYLENYPYDSADAIVSRFLPNVLNARALRQLGISDPDLEQRLPLLVDEALTKLYTLQLSDGGWGWWNTQESNVYVSAYVVFGMLKAREASFTVRDDVLARGLDFLNASLAPSTPTTRIDANRQAWLLFVLAEGGRADGQRMSELFDNRERLGVYGQALLAMALQRENAGDSRLRTLLADLNSAAITSATGAHWEEEERDWWSMGSSTRTTAIALAALVRLDPANQLNPNVVRWLMVARNQGIWVTSQESAWAIIALTDWMVYTRELAGTYDYGVWLNGVARAAGRVDATNIGDPVTLRIAVSELLRDSANLLSIGRGDGPGRLYYTAHLRAFLPVEQLPALDRGFAITRRYVAADCTDGAECPEVSDVQVGDEIRVELEISVANDRYYVRVEDPLPAGGEAVDTSLATTSQLAGDPDLNVRGGEWGWWWYWRWYNRSELRDDRVVLFADFLPRGSYLYSYTMRATLPGEFRVIPTTAGESYFPEVYGRSDGRLLRVAP